jgi:predicted N-acetyltransferase YhbS
MVAIRCAKAKDAPAIHRLNRDSLGYDASLEETKERLSRILGMEQFRIFVAEEDGKTVGYVEASDYELTYRDPFKNVLALAVDEGLRMKGVGRALLKEVEGWAMEEGCIGVRLVSSTYRIGAHQFYVNCGYEKIKEQAQFAKRLQ